MSKNGDKSLRDFPLLRRKPAKPRCPLEVLERILQKPPPHLEHISPIEVYQLDDEGRRKRRICGQYRKLRLPRSVPLGVSNPHGVTNPLDQYRCTWPAGAGTDHLGLGPCKIHSVHTGNVAQLVRRQYLTGSDAMNEGVVTADRLDYWIEQVKNSYTPEDLWDIHRLLVELEALRLQTRDKMDQEAGGFSLEYADEIIKLIKQALDAQLVQVKRDRTLLEMKGVREVVEAFVNGVVHIIERELSPEEAMRILPMIQKEVLVPISEQGYTELLRRQQIAGIAGRMQGEE